MTKVTVIIKSEPYSDESAYTALKLAHAAVDKGHIVELFLVQGGVFCALREQNPSHMQNHYTMLDELITKGVRVVCCGTCTKTRGVAQSLLHPKVEVGSMPILADMITSSDSTVVF
ncbi:MAG: DsrE family protein [Candidatus Thorarchaeota archaeon]|nr:DsrE family protein [Candidatus Thorarchaeota archaeon]